MAEMMIALKNLNHNPNTFQHALDMCASTPTPPITIDSTQFSLDKTVRGIRIRVERIGLKDAPVYLDPFVCISVKGKSLQPGGRSLDKGKMRLDWIWYQPSSHHPPPRKSASILTSTLRPLCPSIQVTWLHGMVGDV